MSHSDCQVLFNAGKALVEKSGLAHYDKQHFVAVANKDRFDSYWKLKFHLEFGRYMAWVLFSVGAENLAKAACVCNGVVKVSQKPTLGNYVNKHFKKLCYGTSLCDINEEGTLTQAYKKLTDVRNRDAHSYRKNVRDADFPLVKDSFVPALNILMKTMLRRGHPPVAFQA